MSKIDILPINKSSKDISRLYQINDEAFPEEERIPSNQLFDIMGQYDILANEVWAGNPVHFIRKIREESKNALIAKN